MSFHPTQPAVTEPHEEDVVERPVVPDDSDTLALTRPLPEAEPVDAGRERPDLLPSVGHIGRYALKFKIGEGGLGTVYAAHDPLLARLIAIKTLHVDLPEEDRAQFNALFLNEAKAAGSLNHPNIVTVYDAGTSAQGTYIAMELLRGKDLRQLLSVGWRPTAVQAALIVRRVADALSYAHHKGVIHRDIKPANIFMVGRAQPRVLDFGIARIRQVESLNKDDEHSRFQEIVGGSPYYMAPEQVRRESVDRRVDVYALGAVLYELLTGQRAFTGNSLEEIADAVLNGPVPQAHAVNADVPKALSDIAAKAMSRDLTQRTRSARALSQELRDWLDESKASRLGDEALTSTNVDDKVATERPKWLPVAIAAGVVLAGGLAWFAATRHHGKAPGSEVAAVSTPVPALQQAVAIVPAKVEPTPVASTAPVVPVAVVAPSAPVAAVAAASAEQPPAKVAEPSSSKNDQAAEGPPGTVTLAVSPWGEVSVDGRSMGVTPPLNQLNLSPGKHTITVSNGDAPVFKKVLVVKSGRTYALDHQF